MSHLNFSKSKVLIVGDIMLDQYWYGVTRRISPEAPVPVVKLTNMANHLGGAGNTAENITGLGGSVDLLGVLGEDNNAHELEKLFEDKNINNCCIKAKHLPTITKLRIMSQNQQLIRLDDEQHFHADKNIQAAIKKKFTEILQKNTVVILSDYGKGTLAASKDLIAQAKKHQAKVLVDPKHSDLEFYRGATVVTPNEKEFEAMAGICRDVQDMVQKAQHLMQQYDIENFIITRGSQGMAVILNDGQVEHIPTWAREVFDVTGAGDTVIGVLAVGIANGMPIVEAAHLANIAAGVVVGKIGTVAITLPELQAARVQHLDDTGVMTEPELLPLVHTCKQNGEIIVFTNGCFDILHSGHVAYLNEARKLGDKLIVAVNSDNSVSKLKGDSRPINKLQDRMEVLAGLKAVDWVVPFAEDTPDRIIRAIVPNMLVKGGDYKDPEALVGAKFVLSQGGRVQILSLKEGRSTSNIIAKM